MGTPIKKISTVIIKMVSSANTGYFYRTTKSALLSTKKLLLRKYDPVIRQHVLFKEEKISRKKN
ncbi:ribosomal protein L33, mitochondrial [Dictyostelium discoideum AX4]|uniref:Large ribosomal subunit protein bL33m n=1 Tax=Dictyostelium discoideum TaxID=44689 RepID=RM33_DICDI|nr:ribosomal protein L33, mitochondrial [Dictyostelium discoideum AX4]Q54YX7.1 RecName: Full=Large ribosomal subunit protein bL33m; AltName: Full=39S ribosomal protein L33, mitochondrial; Short=L33mt; Short=MRP-L33 [Dictyostelium discoideum]EAL68184.1 ribosomal protein L33, mitochondrial [Dictyostelium discoideum AX4]|eukprot:XP_642075.1 ribosomal protein L33, mitochondrial [Dictyostelium discoideum AX4]